MIYVEFVIDDENLVLWQNIGTLHQHFEFNEDTLSDALSAAAAASSFPTEFLLLRFAGPSPFPPPPHSTVAQMARIIIAPKSTTTLDVFFCILLWSLSGLKFVYIAMCMYNL